MTGIGIIDQGGGIVFGHDFHVIIQLVPTPQMTLQQVRQKRCAHIIKIHLGDQPGDFRAPPNEELPGRPKSGRSISGSSSAVNGPKDSWARTGSPDALAAIRSSSLFQPAGQSAGSNVPFAGEYLFRTVKPVPYPGRLRQKLEVNPQFPKHILTVRGSGYRFSP